jgi:transcriptional regulator with XRE-family HTH domain
VTAVDRWSGRETRILRGALRLSVRAFAEDLGVSPRTVSKWEAGGSAHHPCSELQAALDTMLRRASEEDQSRFTRGIEQAPQTTLDDHRSPELPAVIDTGTVVRESAAQAAAFAVWWEATSVGPHGAEVILAELRRLAGDYLTGEPDPVLVSLEGLRDNVFDLLRRHQSPMIARDLHLAAGYTCVLLAWLGGDLGQLGAASTHARAGGLFADTSGSTELQAWVQAVRSKTAFWSGEYRDAVDQANHGLAVAPATGVRVLLAAQVADAWATLGAEQLARAALTEVAAAREAQTDGDTVGGLLSCTQAREANYLSGVYQQLGAPDQAVATAGQALSLSQAQPVRSYATEAQIRLNLVDVFLDLDDLDAAADAFQPVLGLPPERRLHTLTSRVGRFAGPLAASRFAGNQTVQALRQQIASFTGDPLPTPR